MKSSHEAARSAARLIRLHEAYIVVESQQEPLLRQLYVRELVLMIRRAFKLAFQLIRYGILAEGSNVWSNS
jgi:hypothetical protein